MRIQWFQSISANALPVLIGFLLLSNVAQGAEFKDVRYRMIDGLQLTLDAHVPESAN
jgi:hypothetical protein